MTIHIVGFSDYGEPFPHLLIMCGTYFAFFIISFFTCFGMYYQCIVKGHCLIIVLCVCTVLCIGATVPLIVDVIVNSLATICFIATSMLSMAQAENDYHLMYLTDHEEEHHRFFYMNRYQSIASLFTGLWYLMHTVLVLDVLCITEPNIVEPDDAYQPLQLGFCCRSVNEWCGDVMEENRFLKRFKLVRREDRPMDRVI